MSLVNLHQLIQFCKYAGYVLPVIAALIAAGRYVRDKMAARRRATEESQQVIRETNKNVTLLMENHVPHIYEALKEHDKTLTSIQSDVRAMDTKLDAQIERLNDTKSAIHVLGDSFIRHLESSTKDSAPVIVTVPKRRKARVH